MAVDRGMREAVQQQVQRARAADLRDIIPKRSGTGTALDLKKREVAQLTTELAW